MPRVAATLYDFVELDDGEYLKVSEAVLRIFDRQEGLRVNRARARIKFLIDKIGIDEFREMVERGARGRLGRRARLRRSTACCCIDDEEANAPAAAARRRRARTATAREFDASAPANVRPQRQAGLLAPSR